MSREWKEKEWQKYANDLLATHHSLRNEKFQRIPDTNGDHGLEGIADRGIGYQAYADQDSKDHDDRVRKQKKKIYDDLRKLEKYADWWAEFLGDKQIHRWHLLVPDFKDKEVVKYAKLRARELKKKGLSFIADDFDAYVDTQDDFPQAKLMIRDPHLPKRNPSSISDGDIDAFCAANADFIQKIDAKIAKVMAGKSAEARLAYRKKLLRWHLDASNYSEDLERNFPPQWEDLEELITTTGESLETEEPLDDSTPTARLTRTRREFAGALKEKLPFMENDDREVMSWGTVARWLGECPLDFQG
jgi:hypothetical protein